MVSDNVDELAVAAHNAMEQLQYNGHSLQYQEQARRSYSTLVKKIFRFLHAANVTVWFIQGGPCGRGIDYVDISRIKSYVCL